MKMNGYQISPSLIPHLPPRETRGPLPPCLKTNPSKVIPPQIFYPTVGSKVVQGQGTTNE